ncbi:hypothetical protein [Azospirillum argentinense]
MSPCPGRPWWCGNRGGCCLLDDNRVYTGFTDSGTDDTDFVMLAQYRLRD